MRARALGVAFLVTAALALVPPHVGAQVSIGVGGQLLSLGGSDFDGTDTGFGGEGNVLFSVGRSVKLGAGLQYSSHNEAGFDSNTGVLGVLGEARYMFSTSSTKVTPYIAGRGGWARASISVDIDGDGTDETVSASGFAGGGGAGVMITLSPMVGLDLGAVFHAVSLGDAEVDGTTVPNTDSNGSALQVRAGVSFKLGGAR